MEIEEIKKINLGLGDVLSVKLPDEVTSTQLDAIRKQFKSIFPNNKILVHTGNIEYTKIIKEE